MLQAKTKDGTLLTLASLTRQEIAKHRMKSFYCPTCNEQVIIKAGSKLIPHFAHKSKQNCPSYEGGEGPYHEKGKHLLYEWLKRQQLDVQLEVYLPEINQRPDLLVKLNHKTVAIEFQCAKISVDQIKKRNEGYHAAGITPIWFVGANRFKRLNKHHLQLDQFLLHFIHKFSSDFPLTLFFFCPETLQFITFHDIQLSRMNQAFGKFHFSRLTQTTFSDLFQQYRLPTYKIYQLWKKEKQRFRLQQRQHLHGNELAWQQWLYLKQTHLEYLPSIIYLPVSSQYLMKRPLWDWQSRFYIDLLHPLPIGAQLSFRTCQHILRNQFTSPTSFPLIKSNANPIVEYVQLLEQMGITKQLSPHHFTKKNTAAFHKNVEEALKADELFMNQLINSNKIQA